MTADRLALFSIENTLTERLGEEDAQAVFSEAGRADRNAYR